MPGGTGRQIARRGLKFDGNAPYLIGSQCRECSACAWPPAARCHICWGDVRELRLSSIGKLCAWTRIHVAPPGREAPYIVGYVDLPEGVRVFADLRGDPADLAIDALVNLGGANDENPAGSFWFEVTR